jgi:hypothetical protein
MNNLKRYITACLITVALIFNGVNAFAQGDYRLLRKGEQCPFDSGVVSPLRIFRDDTQRIRTGQALVVALRLEVDSLTRQVAIRGDLNKTIDRRLEVFAISQDSLKTTILKLSDSFDQLRTKSEDPGKWYEFKWLPDWAKFLVGAAAGYAVFH